MGVIRRVWSWLVAGVLVVVLGVAQPAAGVVVVGVSHDPASVVTVAVSGGGNHPAGLNGSWGYQARAGYQRFEEHRGIDRTSLACKAGYATAKSEVGAGKTLFHYTDEAGTKGILDSGKLNPSLKSVNPADARYGNGQYLPDIASSTKTCAQLSRCFLGQPFEGQRFTNHVEINVDGLNVVQGRSGVFVVPGETPLDQTGRVVGFGAN